MNNSPEAVRALLLVEDDALLAESLSRAFMRRGYAVEVCDTAHDAFDRISARPPRFAIVDLRLPDGSGLPILRAIKAADAAASVVVLTGYANIATAIESIKLGARNYLCKPVDAEAIAAALHGPQASPSLLEARPPLSMPQLEWEHIVRVHAENRNNIAATARALGMHRRTLQRKLSKNA